MANNSDYTKENLSFLDLLPDVYKNDVSESIFKNTFDRYITSNGMIHVDGYIGMGNPNAAINRQIIEATPSRQAYQLQPILYNKVGTVEHMMSYQDLLNEMRHMGIDTNKLPDWFTPQKFNWIPPIDLDKFINFRDYYWYNPDNPTDQPQYFTIKNICQVVEGRVRIYEKMIEAEGESFKIKGLDASNREIHIVDNKVSIFSKDFIFFTRDTSNPDLLNKNWSVESSNYDAENNRTIIVVQQNFTNDTIVNGVASIKEYLSVLKTEKDCICNGSIGFDQSLLDDNQIGNIVWNTELLDKITHSSFAEWVAVYNTEILINDFYDIWYDTTSNTLKQYKPDLGANILDENNWVIVQNMFSLLVEQTSGVHFWDFSLGCDYPKNQWVDENKWLHKSLVPNFALAKQAGIPIIEFEPYLELNSWSYIEHKWQYREHGFITFSETDTKPTKLELSEINTYELESKAIVLPISYGDLTSDFTKDYAFTIFGSISGLHQVVNINLGLGGNFVVSGNATNTYTSVNDIINVNNLPTYFEVRNSPGGVLDGTWNIDNIVYNIITDETTITVLPTEAINTFSFIGSEIYISNNGLYTVDYSRYTKIKKSLVVSSVNTTTDTVIVNGNIYNEKTFNGYFYCDKGVFAYDFDINVDYDQITNKSTLHVKESLTATFSEIYIEAFRTIIYVNETFVNTLGSVDGTIVAGYSDGSSLIPLKTSHGDVWRGYDQHWLYDGIKTITPISSPNHNPNVSLDGYIIQVNSEKYGSGNYTNNEFEYQVGQSVQKFNITNINGMNRFELHKALHNRVRVGTDSVRVYIQTLDDTQLIRQYGNYDELFDALTGYVNGVEFTDMMLPKFSTVVVEIGANILDDIGLENVLVRTEPDNYTYELSTIDGSDVIDLTSYKKQEQVKTQTNQYPLFDLYDINGNSLKAVSPLFYYVEDVDANINYAVNLRLAKDGNDYIFEQGLVNEKTGEMFCYRDFQMSHNNHFINSNNVGIYYWDNFTWNNRVITDNDYLYTIIQSDEPSESWERLKGQLWYNNISNKLYEMDSNDTFQLIDFDYNTIDTTLKTIWVPGHNNETYEPKYVDANREEVAIGSEDGDWELADPLYYNVHHENRKRVKSSQLLTHFNSIIESQEPIVGFSGSKSSVYHLNLKPNYGLGGTIREYNESIDSLFSSIFLNTTTLERIIDFAHDQYTSNLITLKEIFIKHAVDLLSNTSFDSIVNQTKFLVDWVINEYETNDAKEFVYSDSPTYDKENDLGVKNWVATLPFFGLGEVYKPIKLIDEELGLHSLRHHDGHISSPNLSDAVRESIIRRLLVKPEIRANCGNYLGNNKNDFTQMPPTSVSAFKTAFDSIKLVNGKYWYTTLNGNRTLYRLNITVIADSELDTNYNEGSYYYNTNLDTLYVLNNSAWEIVSNASDGIIESAWEIVDVDEFVLDIQLHVENHLYDVLDKNTKIKYDKNLIKSVDSTTYIAHEEDAFSDFVADVNIDLPYSQIGIYDQANPWTWNYYYSNIIDVPYNNSPVGVGIGGDWKDLYRTVFGTAYPHLEPWVLQGYNSKPDWWDTEYLQTDGTRRWVYNSVTNIGMWANIINGIIPAGYNLPNGFISTGTIADGIESYNYVPVMIENNITGGYKPDDLIPPYYSTNVNPLWRGLFTDYNAEINRPNSDFEFGQSGEIEYYWRVSSRFLYDELFALFKVQPLIMFRTIFGIEYNIINNLQVNRDTHKVYSHVDVQFHGDIIDADNTIYKINGINQWYSNYNRFNGFDTSSSDFRTMWADWTTPLSYQFSSFIDTETFNVFNKNYDIVRADYDICTKQTLGIDEQWLDSFKLSLLKIPVMKMQYDTDHEWVFDLATTSNKSLNYYDVKKYDYHMDNDTGIGTFFKYTIIGYDEDENAVIIANDHSNEFVEPFEIIESTNVGVWTPTSAKYDELTNTTIIKVTETLFDYNIVDGFVFNPYKIITWETGQEIYLESTHILPRPFVQDTLYYYIKVSDYEFAIAETYDNALSGTNINVQYKGSGYLTVGQIKSTFQAISGINTPIIWKHYELDKNNVKRLPNHTRVIGIQNIIDIIIGYEGYCIDNGWVFNNNNLEVDIELGRIVGWQLSLEKLINELYRIQEVSLNVADSFDVVGNSVDDNFEFSVLNPTWGTGTRVSVSSVGNLPDPLYKGGIYYIIRDIDNPNIFQLASSVVDARNGNFIKINDDGDAFVINKYIERESLITFEINPFMNNIWFKPSVGIVSHLIKGAFPDLKSEQTIFDQYGRALYENSINIKRLDDITKISIVPEIFNDVYPQNKFEPTRDGFIHLGGMHLFVDGYENIIRFNDYTTEGFLIYDAFVGLNTKKFDLLFDKQVDYSLRPNIGGKFIQDGNVFVSNIESLTKDLENAYSLYDTSESSDMTRLARKNIGYNFDSLSYFDNLAVNSKSKFIFWKGMIQAKGSINAIKAFVNSRQFIDAKIDEFWAYMVGEYGDTKIKIYPEVNININDTSSNELKIEFVEHNVEPEKNFIPIEITDNLRWSEYPKQKKDLSHFGSHFYFATEITNKLENIKWLMDDGLTEYNGGAYNGDFYIITENTHDAITVKHEVNNEMVDVPVNEYERINSSLIRFDNAAVNNYNNITIYLINVANTKHNPLKIIDYKAGFTTSVIPLWNPAKGHHYHNAEHFIDLRLDVDPAEYNEGILIGSNVTDPKTGKILDAWFNEQVGTVWLDTSMLDYKPYHDDIVIPNIVDRMEAWGKLADYGHGKVYEWTKSDIHPTEWNEVGAVEELDKNISKLIRKSGKVRELVYNVANDEYETDKFLINQYKEFNPPLSSVYVIDSINFDSSNIDTINEYIDMILPKYNIKGYKNGSEVAKVDITIASLDTINDISVLHVTINLVAEFTTSNNSDLFTIIHFKYDVIADDGSRIYPTNAEIENGEYKIDYPHSQVITKNEDGTDDITYYFWVTGKSIKMENNLTLFEVENQLVYIPTAYGFIQDLHVATQDMPMRYSQIIVKGLADTVNDNNRYKLRFTHDFTLRDDIDDGRSSLDLKNTHQEWRMFRKKQPYHIDRVLWDYVTESILGETLDATLRVPSYDDELYDIENNTTTRYGLGEGKLLIDKDLAIDAIISDIYNPDYNFYPVDIDTFVRSHSWDTPDDIKKMMNDIYNNFASEHVNRMFFSILHIAHSLKLDFDNIMKTSMISLHGIRILESGGLYDD